MPLKDNYASITIIILRLVVTTIPMTGLPVLSAMHVFGRPMTVQMMTLYMILKTMIALTTMQLQKCVVLMTTMISEPLQPVAHVVGWLMPTMKIVFLTMEIILFVVYTTTKVSLLLITVKHVVGIILLMPVLIT